MEATGQGQLDVRTTIVVEREASARSRLTSAVRVYMCVCVYVRESRKPRSLVGGEAWKPSEALHCWARRSWRRATTQWRATANTAQVPETDAVPAQTRAHEPPGAYSAERSRDFKTTRGTIWKGLRPGHFDIRQNHSGAKVLSESVISTQVYKGPPTMPRYIIGR